jgi:hypothetical protein
MLLVVVEHASAIATGLLYTSTVASDRLTITSASSHSMSAAWKIGGAGTRYMFIEMQGFS